MALCMNKNKLSCLFCFNLFISFHFPFTFVLNIDELFSLANAIDSEIPSTSVLGLQKRPLVETNHEYNWWRTGQ